MAVLLSVVTLTAGSNQVKFLAASIPRDANDRKERTTYENFTDVLYGREMEL